jgi:hypothetical protein
LENQLALLILAGMAILLIGLIWLVVNLVRYESPKAPLIIIGISVVISVFAGVCIYNSDGSEINASDDAISNDIISEDVILDADISDDTLEEVKSGVQAETSAKKAKFSEVTVEITDKIFIDYDFDYSFDDFIELPYQVINNYDKDIRGIEGIVIIKDMFGKTISSFRCDVTDKIIPSRATIDFYGYGFDYNQYKDDHKKLRTTPFEDLEFEYRISKILFTDGTSIQ